MNSKIFFFCLLILNISFIFANDTIQLQVNGLKGQKTFLVSLSGENLTLVDSSIADSEGVSFMVSKGQPVGVYRILFIHPEKLNERTRKIPYIEFIYNNENVILKSDVNNLNQFPEIISSKENRVYYNFLENLASIDSKLSLLKNILDRYPTEEKFYKQAVKEYYQVGADRQAYIDKMVMDFSGLYASALMRMQQTPVPDAVLSQEQELSFMKEHYFDQLAFSDPLLINSNAYTDRLIEYLSLYQGNYDNRAEQEKDFIIAVDQILKKVDGNPEVYNFILEYLVRGFEKFGMDKVIDHIATNYQVRECESGRPDIIQKRLEAFKNMSVGNVVPNFVVENHLGNTISLNSFDNDYKIVVFWASWCPHCMDLMPKLDKWYIEHRESYNAEIIAVSIDTNASDWLNIIEKYNFKWHNYCGFDGWDNEVVNDYNIYATPTMFIVNRNNVILAKPIEFEELEAFFEH